MIRAKFEKTLATARPIAVDLFSGAGGMSLGFEQAGFDIVFAADRDAHHVAVHKRNFPYGVSYCGSVTELTAHDVRQLGRIESSEIDLVFGGPPCQGFSHMGHRDLTDERNTLVDEFVRLVGELSPRAFVMENVPGMQSGATRQIFERAINSFTTLGYSVVAPVRVLNAMDFGVPQNRPRLFVVGFRADVQTAFEYPATAPATQPARPDIKQAFDGLPTIENWSDLYKADVARYDQFPGSSNAYACVARGLIEDPSDHSYRRLYDHDVVSGCQLTKHSEAVRQLYDATPPGSVVPGHKLPRLDPAGIAPTLRAGSEAERGAHTAPRPIHPFFPRVITAREAARLHGYPDWFSFFPAKWHAYRQIGNSVAPPVAKAVGLALMSSLGLKPRKPTMSIQLDDSFELSEHRKPQQRRVPHLEQYPRVIHRLFERAEKTGDYAFSHADIQAAITETRAVLPRSKPERFVDEIARIRTVRKILATPIARGFSLKKTATGGEFVKLDTAGHILDKHASVRSHDLRSATPINVNSHPATTGDLLGILKRRANAIWQPGVRLQIEHHKADIGWPPQFTMSGLSDDVLSGAVLSIKKKELPSKQHLADWMRRYQQRSLMLITPLTKKHILITLWRDHEGAPVESDRRYIQLRAERSHEQPQFNLG